MSNAVLGLRLKQQLTLTPRLQQSVKLLQLSALECVQELHQAIAQNPFLEESVESAESTDSRSDEETGEDSSRADLDFTSSGGGGGGDETPDWTEWTASPSTLHDSLRDQLLLLGLTERDHVLANLIIDALDDDGFLRLPLEDVAALAPGAAPGEIETALRIVQTLEPNGIAARSLGECLALQLE
ncbi:MAG: RNA polymerase factor sigma-54, partial [Steroidobacteraceae bacterium]